MEEINQFYDKDIHEKVCKLTGHLICTQGDTNTFILFCSKCGLIETFSAIKKEE